VDGFAERRGSAAEAYALFADMTETPETADHADDAADET
jgi:hypothetical protein